MVEQTKKPAAFESRYLLILSLILLLFLAAGTVSYRGISEYRATRLEIQELLQAADTIRYCDEVLTMSARMGAMTGNADWRRRYDAFVPQLDAAIGETIQRFPKARKTLELTSEANQRLITAERRALALAASGQLPAASALLFSKSYEDDKKIYSAGLERLIADIQDYREQVEKRLHDDMLATEVIVSVLLTLVVFTLIYGFRLFSYRLDLERALSEVGRRLLARDRSQLDEGLQWILRLLATKARANNCYLLRRARHGSENAWLLIAQFSVDSVTLAPDRNTLPALIGRPDEDGVVWLPSRNAMSRIANREKAALEALGIGRLLGILLNHGQDYEFFLGLAGREKCMLWTEHDAPLLRTVAEIVAGAIEVREKEEELLRLATQDELTGLANRRSFTDELERELLRTKRSGTSSALMMIDLDHFKQVNDNHGHATGDRLLRHFAECARSVLREVDILGRVGGEEFAAILPDIDIAGAIAAAERLRHELEHSCVLGESGQLKFTGSIGVTLLQTDDTGYESAMKRADRALYAAKKAGRNCVHFTQGEVHPAP